MTEYQFDFLTTLFLWSIVIIDTRNYFCKRSLLWTSVIGVIGVLFISTSIFMNCYLAYYSDGITSLRYDPKIIVDTLLLRLPEKHEDLFFMKSAFFGNATIIAGLEVVIVCKLLKKGLISPRKRRKKRD